MERTAGIWKFSAAVGGVNLLLFGVKLYLGLSTNSIAVFSDAINNLFDALSALATAACLYVLLRSAGAFGQRQLQKGEQLFSFLIAVIVTGTGAYFAYSSLERFMYPTPVWFTNFYVCVLAGTASVKLGLFFLLRRAAKKNDSPVLRMMAFDSILDFFVTAVSILTLILSVRQTFSYDALCGLLISGVILFGAGRQLLTAAGTLIDYVPADTRANLLAALEEAGVTPVRMDFLRGENGITVYVLPQTPPADPGAVAAAAAERTGVEVTFTQATERR